MKSVPIVLNTGTDSTFGGLTPGLIFVWHASDSIRVTLPFPYGPPSPVPGVRVLCVGFGPGIGSVYTGPPVPATWGPVAGTDDTFEIDLPAAVDHCPWVLVEIDIPGVGVFSSGPVQRPRS